ncbi:MAG TPA: O-methyltransferase [Acidobacteriaceae bacterium]|nr:O-methyltransferase [Acidobacteriaceae bacterium]
MTLIAQTIQDRWTAVDQYIDDLLFPSDTMLTAALAASTAAGLPPISVTASQGKLLCLLAQMSGARTILEIGTLGGYSTLWLARALPSDGRIITLESEPRHAEVARANFTHAGMAEKIELRLGSALDTLPQLVAEKHAPFDFIFLDANKDGYPEYLTWSLRLSRPGTIIVADNVVRDGEVIYADSSNAQVQGARRFNQMLASDSRLSATILQTVGSKGYDGLALVRVLSTV